LILIDGWRKITINLVRRKRKKGEREGKGEGGGKGKRDGKEEEWKSRFHHGGIFLNRAIILRP
jgi:hypothetical protein